jgi:hypothetical protein
LAYWSPQPGPQTLAFTCPCDRIFFGGSRGGGKTDTALGRQLYGAETYARNWNGIIFRRKYKDFAELRRRIDQLISEGVPAERIGGANQTNYLRFANGALITLMSMEHPDSLADHQGQQYTEVSIEEAPTIPFIGAMIEKLKGSLRSAAGVPCQMFLTGNPGGPGHMAVKHLFIDSAPPGQIMHDDAGETSIFIKSKVTDNLILQENDPKYVRRLLSITDPVTRKAWIDGDWDVYLGQAFPFQADIHVLKSPPPVPDDVVIYFTYDWGFGKPFSIGWWFIDHDGRVIRFAEWYGCNGIPNEGLRLTDSDVAVGILERERKLGISHRKMVRYVGHDCFAKKPDYKAGDQIKSTAETFAEFGIILTKGNSDRQQKIRQFRERLRVTRDENGHIIEMPMMLVYPTCKDFIRTIPALAMDDSIEDIDTEQEDHVYDEACHIVMARPLRGAAAVYHAAGMGANLMDAAKDTPL